ncbi:hypothetical protein [Acidovorax sp.]|uniref:hypothetical protein n=1 Tax=Acidovorax sp. TaxID=1872122 RepID=UPI0025BD1A44|nr:hypothetical protein [Acidovorax sp.]MBL7090813.1 hypothetical protein [Acidovorax sp.]
MTQKLHCARCGRVTLHPAVVIGAQPFGRVCARKAGLIQPKRRAARLFDAASRVQRDTSTLDLFGGANA